MSDSDDYSHHQVLYKEKKKKKKKEKRKDFCNISTDRDEFSLPYWLLFTGCTVIHYYHQDVLKSP